MTPAIELRATRRAFGPVVALDSVSLTIAPGEFFALLGPSGSGKTTCLRLIAGFDQPDSGIILLDAQGRSGLFHSTPAMCFARRGGGQDFEGWHI